MQLVNAVYLKKYNLWIQIMSDNFSHCRVIEECRILP